MLDRIENAVKEVAWLALVGLRVMPWLLAGAVVWMLWQHPEALRYATPMFESVFR